MGEAQRGVDCPAGGAAVFKVQRDGASATAAASIKTQQTPDHPSPFSACASLMAQPHRFPPPPLPPSLPVPPPRPLTCAAAPGTGPAPKSAPRRGWTRSPGPARVPPAGWPQGSTPRRSTTCLLGERGAGQQRVSGPVRLLRAVYAGRKVSERQRVLATCWHRRTAYNCLLGVPQHLRHPSNSTTRAQQPAPPVHSHSPALLHLQDLAPAHRPVVLEADGPVAVGVQVHTAALHRIVWVGAQDGLETGQWGLWPEAQVLVMLASSASASARHGLERVVWAALGPHHSPAPVPHAANPPSTTYKTVQSPTTHPQPTCGASQSA